MCSELENIPALTSSRITLYYLNILIETHLAFSSITVLIASIILMSKFD